MFCNVFQSKIGLQKCLTVFSYLKWGGVFNILCQGYFCQLVNLTININNHITNLEKYSLSLYGCLICLAVYIVLILKN